MKDGGTETELEQLAQGTAFPSFSTQQCKRTQPSSAAQHLAWTFSKGSNTLHWNLHIEMSALTLGSI